ncbi:hypothetical protein QYM36_012182 [Artemia franciscana]|nr:hypothetical protein QYM36_012182 [Artemia franciscana]
MFITKNRFILKTCGTTTPLKCLSHLIGLVETYSGYNDIEDLYYSRKNYKRPELQRMPHRSFNEEAALLDELFPDGAAYCFGSVNRDCWYLYTLNPVLPAEVLRRVSSGGSLSDGQSDTESIESDGSENSDDSGIAAWLESGTRGLTECQDRDHTIEILMTNLDPELMKIFTKECSKTAAEATEKSGIDRIIPGCVIDDYLFDPCGYSMNGILKTGEYMTIHITPEKEFSYVSFESNISHDCYRAVIQRVLDTFRPGKFVVTAFACKGLDGDKTHKEITTYTLGEDYLRRDLQYCQLKNYDLTYALYSKFPS